MNSAPPGGRSGDSPLYDINVLEVAQYIAGPFAGQQLADFGARVIKIERPDHGDPFRVYAGGVDVEDYGFNYRAYNRNKLSVSLDLQKPAARDVLRRLASQVDVLIENFRPGVMDRLGIGYDSLKQANPALIYCSITGFSHDGPYRDRPAFDTVGQALSGMMYMFTDPEKPRVRGPTIADQATALQATNAILAALYARTRAGAGSRIDISMLDASITFIPDAHAAHTDARAVVGSETRAALSHALVMRCSDGLIAIHLGGIERSWRGLVAATECPEIAEHPLFRTRVDRMNNWAALLELLAPIFERQTRAVWAERLTKYDITCAEVLTIPEVSIDPEVKHSRLFEHIEHPVAGPMSMLKRAARINGSRGPAQLPPALLGEHTDAVLRDLGYGPAEIASLREAGAIGPRPPTKPSNVDAATTA
jgi:crotonobetainyl-CoA:carnitine CoA-transferase CaiB-like acyl-CoA transferase